MTRADDGGVPARRAIVRWSWRLLRRDWRQHLLILSLLTAAVAAAVGFSCAAYNIAPSSARAEFGAANNWFRFNDPEPDALAATLAAASNWFGQIDPIGHRLVPVPGSADQLDYRAQQPDGPFGRPLLALRAGRYPAADDEVAVTRWTVDTLGDGIGATIDLDGVDRHVVGLVENPSELDDRFVLLPPSALAESSFVTMLVDANRDRVEAFRPPGADGRIIASRGDLPENVIAAVIMLVVSTLVLALVALIAAASFAVIAQRRLPQLGMMSAIGATERHVRLSMLATGAVTGVVAAVLGSVIGLGAWIAFAPSMEGVVDARIDALDVPWWPVVAGMLLAVAAATAAAWWPGRTMSRIPTVMALSGRPPKPAALDRSVALAALFLVGGVVSLATGSHTSSEASALDLVMIAGGTLSVLVGILLLGPSAIRGTARLAARVPIAPRLAMRDLSRYQARSGAALAAIALALGIPVSVVAATQAAENNIGLGNLSSSQLLVLPADTGGPFIPDVGTTRRMRDGVEALAAALPDATVVRLDAAVSPTAHQERQMNGTPGISLARPIDKNGWEDLGLVFVGTPALLGALDLTADDVPSSGSSERSDIATSESGDVVIIDVNGPPDPNRSEFEHIVGHERLPANYTSLPHSLIGAEQLAARGWRSQPSGRWLIENDRPLTSAERSAARLIAAQYGFVVETRDHHGSLGDLRWGATGVGMLVALCILAMTVGLMRSESAGELRTLTATGATRSTRRAITATTAGTLAALGAILGTVGAYIALAAGRLSDLTPLPLATLGVIAVGTPLVAAAIGWLFAGREPSVVARRPIE